MAADAIVLTNTLIEYIYIYICMSILFFKLKLSFGVWQLGSPAVLALLAPSLNLIVGVGGPSVSWLFWVLVGCCWCLLGFGDAVIRNPPRGTLWVGLGPCLTEIHPEGPSG